MAQQARFISVVLLFVTLAAGFMLGMAWDTRRPAQTGTAEVVAIQTPDVEETQEDAEQGDTERERGPVIYEVVMQPEQRAAVDEIIVHFRSSMDALREAARRDYDRERMDLLMATQDSIKAVLNADQIAEYDSLLAARYSPDRGERGDSRRDGSDDERPGEGEAR